MNKILFFLGGSVLGYALNTKSGKKLRSWAFEKAQDGINNLVTKVDEITTTAPSPEDAEKTKK